MRFISISAMHARRLPHVVVQMFEYMLLLLLLLLLLQLPEPANAQGLELIVNTTSDGTGAGTLRWAITTSNRQPEHSFATTIEMNLPPSPGQAVFAFASALPAITRPVTLDGGVATPQINCAGIGAGAACLNLTGSNITVQNLDVAQSSNTGILIQGQDIFIQGVFVYSCSGDGILLTSSSRRVTLLYVSSYWNQAGLRIATSADLSVSASYFYENARAGVNISSSGITFGEQGQSNIIYSWSNLAGVDVFGNQNLIQNVIVGLTPDGYPGSIVNDGISIRGAENQIIDCVATYSRNGFGILGNFNLIQGGMLFVLFACFICACMVCFCVSCCVVLCCVVLCCVVR